jgi:hypothetical protein
MRRISLGRSGRPNAPVILPPQTRGLVSCLSQREDLGQCHALAGGDAALRQALGTVDRLKADGRSSLGQESSGAIRNIIGVSKGIRDDDWASVLRYGGPEVYKAAVKIVLNVLFPGLGPLIDRVTEEVVQSRVDLVEGLIKAAKARDQQKIAQLTIEFYLVMNIIPSCAIVPPGDFKNATCGSIGEVVQALAKSGGELTDFAVNRLEDVLNLVGIDTGRPFFSECGTSSNYYASRYLRCLHRGVYRAQGWEDVEGVVASHNNRCRRHYGGPPKECHVQSSLGPICEPLNSQFRSNVRDVSAGLTSAARAYVGSMRSFVQSKGVRACAADFDRIELRQFTDQCESSLRKRIPLLGDPSNNDPDCNFSSQLLSAPSAHRRACEKAIQRVSVKAMKERVCESSETITHAPVPWAAVAINVSGRWGASLDTAPPDAIARDALGRCGEGCRLAAQGPGRCVAVAHSKSNGIWFGYAHGDDRARVEAIAMKGCSDRAPQGTCRLEHLNCR